MAHERQSTRRPSAGSSSLSAVLERMTLCLDRAMTMLETVASRIGANASTLPSDHEGDGDATGRSGPLGGEVNKVLESLDALQAMPGNEASGRHAEQPGDALQSAATEGRTILLDLQGVVAEYRRLEQAVHETATTRFQSSESVEPSRSLETSSPDGQQPWGIPPAMSAAGIGALGAALPSIPSTGLAQLQNFSNESATRTNQTEHIKVARDQLAEQKKTNQLLEKQAGVQQAVFGT